MEIYQMTLQEYIKSMKGKRVEHFYYNRFGQLVHNHQDAVIDALQRGKQIPPEVIASLYYPLPPRVVQIMINVTPKM